MVLTSPRSRAVAAGAHVAILAALVVLAAVGWVTPWLVILWAVMPGILVIREWLGAPTAVALGVLGLLSLAMLGLVVSPLLGAPIVAPLLVLSAAIGLLGSFAVLRAIAGVRVPARLATVAALAPALGAVVWVGVQVVARVRDATSALSWAMGGDAANNVLFARTILDDHGFRFGGSQNPVPLPPGLLAIGMATGRGSVASGHLLRHDIDAFTVVWSGIIVALCILFGVVATMWIEASRPVVRAVVGAGASLLPLTWWIAGYPVDYGFLNAHVAMLIVLGGCLLFGTLSKRPGILLGALSVCGTLLLAVWSPLVILPAILFVVVVVQHRTMLLRQPPLDLTIAIVGVLQLLAYGLTVTVPSLLAQGGALASAGGAFPFPIWVFIAVSAAALITAVIAWRAIGSVASLGAAAVLATALVGYGALLFAARATPNPVLSYYPSKFAWLAAVFLFLIDLSLVVGFSTRWLGRVASTVASLVIIGALSLVLVRFAPSTQTGYVAQNPLVRILVSGYGTGDTTENEIFASADLNAPTLWWKSGDPFESTIDFWVLQMQAKNVITGDALHSAAYGINGLSGLCTVIDHIHVPLTIRTADPALAGQLSAMCPADNLVVSLQG